jgi:ABC-type lipoprotein export system ATPase subunit
VAIARGLVNRPPVILADEPTAPLDSERVLSVIRMLNDMARTFETAIIVVTHDEKIIPTFKRIYHMRDGGDLRGSRPRARISMIIFFRKFCISLEAYATSGWS